MHSAADDFDSAGVKIHFAVAGSGEPVVLIHGLYANGRINWLLPGITESLAKYFQVITPDCRGHGRSGKPQGENAYGVNMVEDVVHLMDHLSIKSARIAGYSMGAMIAMKLAVTHPERVSAMVLGGMGWLKTGAPRKSVWDKLEKPLFTVPPECPRSFPQLAVTEAEIEAVKTPVTVLIGEHDPCLQWYVEPLHQVRPDWPVHIIPDADHLNCITKPEFKSQCWKPLG